MPDTTTTDLPELVEAAESAVAELEALKPDAWIPDDGRRGTAAPWTDAQREAEQATEALRAVATVELFPDRLAPVGADLLADLEHYACPIGFSGAAMADLHGRALESYSSLAAFIRTAHVVDQVRRAARSPITGRRDPVAENVAAFVGGVAAQLSGTAEFEPAASILVEPVPGVQARIAPAVNRCEAEAEVRARAELAAWFRGNTAGSIPLRIGHERLEGGAIAERIDTGDEDLIDLARHYWLHHPAGGGLTTQGRAIYA